MRFTKVKRIGVTNCATNQNPNLPPIRQDYGNGHNPNLSSYTAAHQKQIGAYNYYGITGLTTNSDSGNGTGDWCPANQYIPTVNFTDGEEITATEHNSLKSAIVLELQRRHRNTSTANAQTVSVGDVQTNERILSLRNELTAAAAWTPPSELQNSSLEDGDYIQSEQYQSLKTRLNEMADDCVCNCNYCTCNCNYCTCNCNYACTCNCNYSDLNLKEDVQYAA